MLVVMLVMMLPSQMGTVRIGEEEKVMDGWMDGWNECREMNEMLS